MYARRHRRKELEIEQMNELYESHVGMVLYTKAENASPNRCIRQKVEAVSKVDDSNATDQ